MAAKSYVRLSEGPAEESADGMDIDHTSTEEDKMMTVKSPGQRLSADWERQSRFWCTLVDPGNFPESTQQCRNRQFWRMTHLDTSIQRVRHVFAEYSALEKEGEPRRLPNWRLPEVFETECGIKLSESNIRQAVNRVSVIIKAAHIARPEIGDMSQSLSLETFSILWQFILMGCALSGDTYKLEKSLLELIIFDHSHFTSSMKSVAEVAFGEYSVLRNSKPDDEKSRQWCRIDNPDRDCLKAIQMRFRLSTSAMEGAVGAAASWDNAITRAAVFDDHVLVDLEIYRLDTDLPLAQSVGGEPWWSSRRWLPMKPSRYNVGSHVQRSAVTLILTTSDTFFKSTGSDAWETLISLAHANVNKSTGALDEVQTRAGGAVDEVQTRAIDEVQTRAGGQFTYHMEAATELLKYAKKEYEGSQVLCSGSCDMLLCIIIDQVVSYLERICEKYNRQVQDIRLDLETVAMIPGNIAGVLSNIDLELLELVQFAERLDVVFDQLKGSIFASATGRFGQRLPAIANSSQKSLKVSKENLQAAQLIIDQIREDKQMQADNFMNQILFLMAMVTSFFTPPTFLAGVFGMNFVHPNHGDPSIPILVRPNGYRLFWMMCLTAMVVFPLGVAIVLSVVMKHGVVRWNLILSALLSSTTFFIYFFFSDCDWFEAQWLDDAVSSIEK